MKERWWMECVMCACCSTAGIASYEYEEEFTREESNLEYVLQGKIGFYKGRFEDWEKYQNQSIEVRN